MTVLPPRLFPSSAYYRAMLGADRIVVDSAVRYDKRCKAVHRYDIIDVRGPLQLTVPLAKPHGCEGKATWRDAAVSTHDEWWRRHRVALESAYGRTPYFEFLIDRFSTVFRSPEQWDVWPSAIDLIREANRAVLPLLAIDAPVVYDLPADAASCNDLRTADFDCPDQPVYWQVRDQFHGFHGGLSILDLLFNLGPESAIYLRKMG